MNLLSVIPRSEGIFFPLVVGSTFLWNLFFMEAFIESLKEGKLLVLKNFFFYFSGIRVGNYWLFFILVLSYVLGYYFTLIGDMILTSLFGSRSFSIEKLISGKQVVIERITLSRDNPVITTDVFLGIEENYHLNKSEYYYFLSSFFSGLFLSFFLLSVVFTFASNCGNTYLKIAWFLFIILSAVLVTWKPKKLILLFLLLLTLSYPIYLLYYFITNISDPKLELLKIKTIVVVIYIGELVIAFLSYYLAIWSRELANYFLYLAFLKTIEKAIEGIKGDDD